MASRIFSGAQPSGSLTIGNYLGAIKNWVQLQHEHQSIFCVVDLHAITVPQNPAELREKSIKTLASYIACGIDPSKSYIFIQSMMPEHTELAWILGCHTPVGWLKRMTQFKEKAGKKQENASLGLFGYPCLMAADILLYKANLVPVGDDQFQHLELTRDIATSFNNKYGQEFFPLPQPLVVEQATRIMSLREASNKMSKSDVSDHTRINIDDAPELIAQKIRKAKTDAIEGIYYDKETRPEVSNLLNIFSAFSNDPISKIQNEFENKSTSEFKIVLSGLITEILNPIQQELKRWLQQEDEIIKIAQKSAEKLRPLAEKTLKEVREIVGFLPVKKPL